MANPFGCSPPVDCPGTDSPVLNYTSETPDRDLFVGMAWGSLDNNEQDPTTNQTWTDTGCVATCSSQISQEDADLCALLQASQCAIGKRQNSNNTFPPVYQNSTQFCNSKCPDGQIFTYTVAAGTFMALSQLLADEKAASFACTKARQHRICFGSLTPLACVGTPYSSTIVLTGGADDPTFNFWDVSTGDSSLPPGLSLSAGFSATGVTLSGTPTKGGTYNFTVRMTTLSGDFMEKAYTICVADLSPATLPDGTVGIAYSQVITENTVCLGRPLNRTLKSGTLPPGLVLTANPGVLSGTPTTVGLFSFTISATDPNGQSCSRAYKLNIVSGACACPANATINFPGGFDAAFNQPGPCQFVAPGSGYAGALNGLDCNTNNVVIGEQFGASQIRLECTVPNPCHAPWTLIFENGVGGTFNVWRGVNNTNCVLGVYTKVSGCNGIASLTIS